MDIFSGPPLSHIVSGKMKEGKVVPAMEELFVRQLRASLVSSCSQLGAPAQSVSLTWKQNFLSLPIGSVGHQLSHYPRPKSSIRLVKPASGVIFVSTRTHIIRRTLLGPNSRVITRGRRLPKLDDSTKIKKIKISSRRQFIKINDTFEVI